MNKLINREISWLSFNARVLQEAENESVPLIERLRFLGIFSNNMDEFFRVRVATLKRMTILGKKSRSLLEDDPETVLDKIHSKVITLQHKFDQTYEIVINLLHKEGIVLINDGQIPDRHHEWLHTFFKDRIRPHLIVVLLNQVKKFPWLNDKTIYLVVVLKNKTGINEYALIEIPSNLNRFYEFPSEDKRELTRIIILEDIIRFCLNDLFSFLNYSEVKAYTIKLTRDAELDIDDDIDASIVEKISKSVKNRKIGSPVRFVYDANMPEDAIKYFVKKLKLKTNHDFIPGGRYHNRKDFINFPSADKLNLIFPAFDPVLHPELSNASSLIKHILKNDVLLQYPYQSFDHIIDLLREASLDPLVISIKINLYRVAGNSKVINALINAVRNGKKVVVVIELRARFDEEANIHWASKLKEEGATVLFGVPGLKVHSKMILITRKDKNREKMIAHIGTGNFHEGTAKIYSDTTLLTGNARITSEVAKVFEFFNRNYKVPRFNSLLVSPYNTRSKYIALINAEIKNAKNGLCAFIILKLNNLVDSEMINKLYEASNAGVDIKLIIRGVCSLVPGVKGQSANISAVSIVGRFLEHSRLAVFCSGGNPKIFLSSADWMVRNLDRRVEVSVPILDEKLKRQILHFLDFQLKDNVKSRKLDKKQKNYYKTDNKEESKRFNSQEALYQHFRDLILHQ